MPELKLKPCPFCGGEAYLLNMANCMVYVKCKSCKAETGGVHIEAGYCANDKAVEVWNRRAEETSTPIPSKEEALEPEYEGDGYDDNGENVYDTAYCPICRNRYEVDYDNHDNYCRNCGQKLDWRRVNENDN